MLLVASLVVGAGADPAHGGSPGVPGQGTAHPRVLYGPGDEAVLRDRLTREPYATVFRTMHARAAAWNLRPLGDPSLSVHRDLSRAAKVLAFEYALDRTVVGGEIVPFPDAPSRQAVGDRVRDLLVNLFPRSRLAVPPPVGGWDRDISTSEEIVNYATALDTLWGAGYDLGPDHDTVVERLAAVTAELHLNFVDPSSVGGLTNLHQNNHRSKSGAAMAVAAVVLADEVPAARDWFDDGVLLVDDVLRFMLVTGDGAYGEGPFYYRFTTQNLAPLLAVWDRFLGDQAWTARGVPVPAMRDHPQFRRTQRWMLDTTVPDGTMAPVDDANPGRSHYFGLVPPELPEAAAAYWRWADTPQPFETDGNIEVGPDVIATYDDRVTPRPPWWSPTQFYVEGGTASLRSDWSADAVMALVLGEHDTASEFGRDRAGAARAPQSHEHAEPGSFLLHAYGERLALDPGYLTFSTHDLVNQPEHHNVVLVDGAGPPDYLAASFGWLADPDGRPPAEGQSTLHDTLDGAGLDAVGVASWYRDTELARRFLLADERYLVVADGLRGPGGSLSWMLHGNGGGTSGGAFEATASGGRWTIGGARLDSGIGVVDHVPSLDTVESVHEVPYIQQRTHTALRATVPTGSADAVQVLYPTRVGSAPPSITSTGGPGSAGLTIVDTPGDRRVRVGVAAGGGLQVADEHLDGTLRLVFADGTTSVDHDGTTLVETATPGTLGLRRSDDGALDVVAQTPDTAVRVGPLGPGPVDPARVDGACDAWLEGDDLVVDLNRERRFTVRDTDVANSRPAADPGADRRVAVGDTVALDGGSSCDADGDALTPTWELVSAPAGSAWSLTGTGSFRPALVTDRPGPYRVRLTVTDARGAQSLEQEVVVIAGDRCADGVDDDLDGRIDTDDPDCDGPEPPPGPDPNAAVGPPPGPPAEPPFAPVPTDGRSEPGPVDADGTGDHATVPPSAPATPTGARPRFTG